MSIVNTDTGEIVEPLSREAAELITQQIELRLNNVADNLEGLEPLVQEARDGRAHVGTGFRSWPEYVQGRFGDRLERIARFDRGAVVHMLSNLGMSNRAIAGVINQPRRTVDYEAGKSCPPDPQTPESTIPQGEPVSRDVGSGQTPDAAGPHHGPSLPSAATMLGNSGPNTERTRPKVTGVDGKSYPKAAPKPKLPDPPPLRDPDEVNARQWAENFAGHLVDLLDLSHPHMRATRIKQWGIGREAASPVQRGRVNPDNIRAVGHGLLALADEWSIR